MVLLLFAWKATSLIIHVELKISSNKFLKGVNSFVKDVLQLEEVSLLLRISLYLKYQHPHQIPLKVCI